MYAGILHVYMFVCMSCMHTSLSAYICSVYSCTCVSLYEVNKFIYVCVPVYVYMHHHQHFSFAERLEVDEVRSMVMIALTAQTHARNEKRELNGCHVCLASQFRSRGCWVSILSKGARTS